MEGLEFILPLIFGALAIYLAVEFLIWIFPYLLLAALLAVCVGLVCVLYRSREAVARWYYFTFSPHPAEPMVRSTLHRGRPLDGERLASILADAPPSNRILREVRITQGERLVAEMRQVSEATIHQNLKSARSDQERAAFLSIQEAIALAAVAVERAKAAYAASKAV